ncbi:DNA polymerase III subunit delta' C-terminal domain-containing protein [Pantoea sp. Nvir]|uniref:DNA polymerase III subunit delta' C-terminal domain-containing protein n=1 Tax=Pantoea sp. Nvir TaxID=2576760 RepID=UPI0027F5427C|nr:DNA polymerase III subunit delta' C-terminal domain-containing protein [Pantoea sp. Nvir]CAJ0991560.1 DNA polymerase III subunit delta' [Pantoea sp. Nvir]
MKWYPWLNQLYQYIINQHQVGRAHHALLVKTINGIGDDALVWGVSRWLMCQKPDGLKTCRSCHGCRLMQAQTHPDWYCLEAEKGKSTLGIDMVRQVIEQLYDFAQQGGAKVVWFPYASQLSESAANTLLKTLEEPPTNSWFFLSSLQPSRLPATLRSRCMAIALIPPDELQSLQWLSQQAPCDKEVLQTALRLNTGSPPAALQLLEPVRWQLRQALCNVLHDALQEDILKMLPVLLINDTEDVAERISWLLALLVDAIKWQQCTTCWMINPDRHDVVALLANFFSSRALNESTHEWMQCRENLLHVGAINCELLLTDQLLRWANRRNTSIVF